jgi:hypothetical protein
MQITKIFKLQKKKKLWTKIQEKYFQSIVHKFQEQEQEKKQEKLERKEK